MPDWLTHDFDPTAALTTESVIVRLLAAAFFGIVVAFVYRLTFGKKKPDSLPFAVTLALLSCLVAMTTLIIGNNQALAFSLVGTLAIVRFRTAMDDTRDTAFVIFAVAVGMGSAVGALRVVLVGLPVVTAVVVAASLLARRTPPHGPDRTLSVRLAGGTDPTTIDPALTRLVLAFELMGVETGKANDALELTYRVRFRDAAMIPVVTQLRTIPGVTTVEIKPKA
jgi:hypothetical protein